jgi:3-oxoacyl-(acyl-carrier-protein) synthase
LLTGSLEALLILGFYRMHSFFKIQPSRSLDMSTLPVVVTGVGPVSAIGCGRNEFWDALVAGKHGFGPITLCDPSGSPSKIAAEVKDFDLARYVARGGVMARHTPRPVQMGLAAGVLALHDAELDLDALGQSMRMIQAGAVDAMLVVGTDCEVVPEAMALAETFGGHFPGLRVHSTKSMLGQHGAATTPSSSPPRNSRSRSNPGSPGRARAPFVTCR